VDESIESRALFPCLWEGELNGCQVMLTKNALLPGGQWLAACFKKGKRLSAIQCFLYSLWEHLETVEWE
jgi:hypothetical protein